MNTVVTTRHGELRGAVVDGVYTFKGVSYAAPPFGANRLRPPQPVEPWSGVRDALTFGPTPPQLANPPLDAMFANPTVAGEDCLNLNIWSPDPGSAGLPVMVWIPGGAFESGTGAAYDGSHFADDGIVCVTINYRVGAEGFLYLGEGNGNRGLLDQIAALQWVRENIAAFGGDPGNVTIFGQSAGGMSVSTLLSVPGAAGLFRRAIAQSGAAHHVISATTAQQVGACHGLEIAFVFDRLGNGTEPLLGANPPQHLADTMHAAWVAFASRGDPGWPKYDLRRRATMRFDLTSRVVNDPRSPEWALWEGVR